MQVYLSLYILIIMKKEFYLVHLDVLFLRKVGFKNILKNCSWKDLMLVKLLYN